MSDQASPTRVVKKITDLKFLNIYEVKDPKMHVGGYLYAERLGVDSVAFVCWDPNRRSFLLNKEYKPPVDEFITGAFGGSLDKDKSPEEIVIEEVKQEAGFAVKKGHVFSMGKVLVSTQMNQFCHLYVVLVDRKQQEKREPEDEIEAMAEMVWVKEKSVIKDLKDWKAITIISIFKERLMSLKTPLSHV